jgi:hypothetical protein
MPVPPTPLFWKNVRDFGAIGDGVTEDSAAIQAAITAAFLDGGGTVYFPSGKYLVSSSVIVIPPNATISLRLTGDGSTSIIVPSCGLGVAYTFNVQSLTGTVEIDHLVFDGSTASQASAGNAVVSFYVTDARLHDLYFVSCTTGEALINNVGGYLDMERVKIHDNCNVSIRQPGVHSAYVKNQINVQGWKSFRAVQCWFGLGWRLPPKSDHIVYSSDCTFYTTIDSGGQNYEGNGFEFNPLTGHFVQPQRFMSDQITFELDQCFTTLSDSAAIMFDPTEARYRRIWIHDSNISTIDGGLQGAGIEIKQADTVKLERVWIGTGGDFSNSDGVILIDAGNVVMDNVFLDGDDNFRPPVAGALYISADINTRNLKVIDSNFLAIAAACPVTVERSGVIAKLHEAVNVPADVLVKLDPSTPGNVLVLGTADSAALAVGATRTATARATGFILFDAAFDITEGDQFPLFDGVNASTPIVFSLVGAPGAVSVTNAMTADQRATATAAFINGIHGPGFQITATAVGGGSGRVNLINDNEGTAGNISTPWLNPATPGSAGSVSIVIGSIRVFAMSGGQSTVEVVELRGQPVTLLSDGSAPITVGDVLEPSPTVAGRVRSGNSSVVAVAQALAAATLDATVSALIK